MTNISKTTTLIKNEIRKILIGRREVVSLACARRSKFEGWLKFELAAALTTKQPEISSLVLEDGYLSNRRSDLSFVYEGDKYFVEMKTANTNWRVEGVENLHRPVAKNISGIIENIQILNKLAPPAHGIAVFTIFPIPYRLLSETPAKLNLHLDRIERETNLELGSLRETMDYVPISDQYGLGVFVISVI